MKISILFTIVICFALVVNDINASPASLLCLVNKQRWLHWRRPLALDDRLIEAAQLHTEFMAFDKNLTHDDPSGDLGKRILDQGFLFWMAGENIAFGWNEEDDAGVMNAWMNSPGHRANILETKFTHFGSGWSERYWTQDFGESQDGRPPHVPYCPDDVTNQKFNGLSIPMDMQPSFRDTGKKLEEQARLIQ